MTMLSRKSLRSFFGNTDTVEFRSQPKEVTIRADLLPELLPKWTADNARRTSRESADAYRHAVNPFFIWWDRSGPEYDWELSKNTLLDFHGWLRNEYVTQRGKPPSHNGQAQCLSRLRMLFRWASSAGYADMDISNWVPTMQQKPKAARLRNPEALRLLMRGALTGENPIRDACIMGIIAGTGARSIEVYHARFDPGYLEIYADKSGWIYFEKTKNDRPRTSIFGPGTGRLIEAWMDECGRETGEFWRGELAAPKAFYEVVSRCADRAGLGVVGPHDIRKLFCTHWYKNYSMADDRAQFYLGAQIGHSRKGVTEKHYLHVEPEDIRPFYVSPLDGPLLANFVDEV